MSMTVGSVIVNSVISPAEVWDEYYIALHGAHNALRVAFIESGISQEKLADRLGIDKALVSKRLNGSENLTIKTLSQMGTAIGRRLIIAYEPFDNCGVTNQYSTTPIHWIKPSSTFGTTGIIINVNNSEYRFNTGTGSNASIMEVQKIG